MTENYTHNGPEHNSPDTTDTASKSLAEALRLSFLLLSILMIGVVVAFILTGLTQIRSDQCGVKLFFGRIQGEDPGRILAPGLRWSVPEPIGQVIKVPTGQRKVQINDFWFHETAQDANTPLSQRRAPSEGLRPGWDGALLTGDRGLVHVKLICFYSLRRKTNGSVPSALMKEIPPETRRAGGPDPEATMKLLHNVTGLEIDPRTGSLNMRHADGVVRSAVCGAAICAAATRTVESIYPTGQKEFADAVAEIAQQRLNKLVSGIKVERIEVPISTVPLAAIGAFDAVTSAATERERRINEARGDANNMLSAAAGRSWITLVGDDGTSGLLQEYADAREQGDEAKAKAAELLEKINNILMSNKTGGGAARIINEAKAYSATIRQRVQARADRFEKLIDKFLATPELMLQRLWAEKKEGILSSPTNRKYYLTPSQKTILRISQDPKVKRRIMREILKAGKEQQENRQK